MDKEYLQKFAKNLKKLRNERKLTQEDLESDDISRSMISLIEISKTDFTITKARALAKSLGITMRELFDFDE